MNKKILTLGCIFAIAILFGVSFTSVVGYSNTRTKLLESPLYNIRTNRAIENGEDVPTCDYVGKSKGFTIPISEWDNLGALRQQLLDKFKGMNEKELKVFKNEIIRLINQKRFTKEINNAKQLILVESVTEDGEFTCDDKTPKLCEIIYITYLILQLIILLPFALIEFGFVLITLFFTVLFRCIEPTDFCPTSYETCNYHCPSSGFPKTECIDTYACPSMCFCFD